MQAFIFIRHPGHLTFPCANIGCRDILGRVNKVALGQFLGKAAGDPFKLGFSPIAWIDYQPALGPTKRYLDQRTFEGHQCGQRLNFILVNG